LFNNLVSTELCAVATFPTHLTAVSFHYSKSWCIASSLVSGTALDCIPLGTAFNDVITVVIVTEAYIDIFLTLNSSHRSEEPELKRC
jgi:hypothetical protein